MSQQQQQQAIDPALRSTPSDSKPQPLHYQQQPPPQFSAPSATLNTYPTSPPQPYYQYPTPQTHTPHAPGTGAPSSASHSNQTSPQNAGIAYEEHNEQEGGEHSPDDGNAAPGEDPKRPRACEACRGLKVRCDQDPAHPELPCRRCAKAGRQCIITAPSRKRQKKADSRVAELEKKLDALTAVLQQQQQTGHSQQPQYGSPYANAAPTAQMAQQYAQQYGQPAPSAPSPMQPSTASMQPPQKRRRTEEDPQQTPSLDGYGEQNTAHSSRYQGKSDANKFPQTQDSWGPNADMMRYLTHRSPEEFMNRINSLVNPDLGVSIFNRYVTKMSPHMPAVVFPQGTTAEQVWKEKPILYVCILSAGSSGILHPDTCKQLSRETIRAMADCVVCNGAKSLELIQAMQVIALWYKPPEKAEQTNFYQIIHMAAVMAIDIGLGKRFNASKARRGFGGPHSDYAPGPHLMLPINSDTIEARRAWLGCYYLCASASMVLRRPNLVHWTKYMQECVDILETSSEALPSDKLFCQHIKIQHICEEVSVQFLMDDSTASISITDPKVTYTLNVLENDLKKWSEDIPAELKSHSGLRFFEHVASLYLHEIALHFNHNIDDFRLPFTEESLKSVNNSTEKLTQNQIAALEACRKAAHGLLDHMLSFDVETVKVLPMLIFFVRCTYAIVILIKMHVAITTPGSEISKMMTTDDINAEYYLDGLLSMFSHVASEQEFRPHPKVLRILSVLKDWFRKHKENVAAQSRGEQLPHPPTSTQQEAQNGGNGGQYSQTPLHMLSQVATANQTAQQQGQSSAQGEWTFNTPFPVEYGRTPHPDHPDSRFPVNAQQQQSSTYPPPPDPGAAYADGFDPATNPWLWGSNFQQAMDLNLAAMEGISGGGMDGLFLGDGFGFNGEFQ
ncbi:Transcriptional regulator WAR1 [Pseudocercospora fuligena]|uniref:Transcriptional regulator WAR1 n=1 Tax=Pseudocercospora fuligena TaxID=685502 RepID=A0A8H6RBC8_9PEZI|nr:Transcriptional regulator WAR1 [Pseudocercospora fuligena]